MKDRVVCINGKGEVGKDCSKSILPIEGQIYTVMRLFSGLCSGHKVNDWYILEEFGNDYAYDPNCFRPVDDTFGSWVEETIMKEAELETVLI